MLLFSPAKNILVSQCVKKKCTNYVLLNYKIICQ